MTIKKHDNMSEDDIKKEMDFWIYYNQPDNDFKHKQFYIDFFDFTQVKGDILEVGCGGSPFVTYTKEYIGNNQLNLTLIDPLISEISKIEKYSFLNQYKQYTSNLISANIPHQYDFIICLNVLDHFGESYIDFITKIKSLLTKTGQIYIYYDIRKIYSDGHYPIDHSIVHQYIINNFHIIKESLDINPVHRGWSTVYQSYRGILSQ